MGQAGMSSGEQTCDIEIEIGPTAGSQRPTYTMQCSEDKVRVREAKNGRG